MKSDAQHRSGQPERRGFTLLETLLVLGLISMLAAVLVGGSAQLLKGTARSDPEDALMAMLQTLRRQAVERGQILCKPGSVKPHTTFEAEAYILTKEEGGRHTPFFANYRPQFYFRTTDVTGTVQLPEGTEMVMPGDNLKFNVELIAPIAMEDGLRFAIREGGRTVGAGVVAKIIA